MIFDALTLPISTGLQEDYRTAGVETLEAVRRIKQELPEVKTILGVSNISFGLNAYARRVLNSVFMHEAVERGLDMAIVNYSKIYPLYKIPEAEVELARKLIFQDRTSGDPLQRYMAQFAALGGRERDCHHRTGRFALHRGQAQVLHHPGRKGDRRRRREARPGGAAGDCAGDIYATRDDQQRVCWTPCELSATCSARAKCSFHRGGFRRGDEGRRRPPRTQDGKD